MHYAQHELSAREPKTGIVQEPELTAKARPLIRRRKLGVLGSGRALCISDEFSAV